MNPIADALAVAERAQRLAQSRPKTPEQHWRARLAGQGSISKPEASIGGWLERKTAQGLGGLLGERRGAQIGGRLFSAVNDLSPVGNVTGAEAGGKMAYRGLTKGNLGAAALGALSLGLSVVPGSVARKAQQGLGGKFRQLMQNEDGAIRAWHGSPHDFDRFDMSKMGSGEGNQSYGRGLYFADNPGVASSYVQPRGAEPNDVAPEVLAPLRDALRRNDYLGFDTLGQAIHAVRSNPLDYHKRWEVDDAPGIRDALAKYDEARWPVGKRPRLYEVEIDAEPEQFFDLDSAPRRVTEAEALAQGYRGFKYLDQGSRGTGNGTRNYVVFDDALVDILNKY